MTLRKKIIITILAILVCGTAISSAISLFVLFNGFNKVETETVQRNVERVNDALNDDLATLEGITRDWAAWDDTYTFIDDENKYYLESNLLSDDSFLNNRVSLMVFINKAGKIVFAQEFDLTAGKAKSAAEDLAVHIGAGSILLTHTTTESITTGLILLSEGPMIISAQPILKSDRSGPARGTLIFGRLLDRAEISKLASKTHLTVQLQSISNNLPTDFLLARESFSAEKPIFVKPFNNDLISGYTSLKDVYGQEAVVLRVEMPRSIYQQGITTMISLLVALVVMGLLFSGSVFLVINKQILSRLSLLSKYIPNIGVSGDLTSRLPVSGKDEITSLTTAVNKMLEALEGSHNELKREKESVEMKVKERTRELSDEHARLEASINSLNVGFVLTDVRQKVIVVNDTAKRMFCYGADAHGTGAIHTKDLTEIQCNLIDIQDKFAGVLDIKAELSKSLTQKNIVDLKNVAVGTAYYHIFLAPIVVLRGKNLDLIGSVILVEDITQVKQLERSRDEFFSIASHELRTPLTAIRGNSAMIEEFYADKLKDKNMKEMVDDIHASSIRLIEIVNDFLDTNRLEQSKIEFKN